MLQFSSADSQELPRRHSAAHARTRIFRYSYRLLRDRGQLSPKSEGELVAYEDDFGIEGTLDQTLSEQDFSDREEGFDLTFRDKMTYIGMEDSSTSQSASSVNASELSALKTEATRPVPIDVSDSSSSEVDSKASTEATPKGEKEKPRKSSYSAPGLLSVDFDDPEVKSSKQLSSEQIPSNVDVTLLFQTMAEARELAKSISEQQPMPSTSRAFQPGDWEETERILYERAAIRKPNKHRMAPAEKSARELNFDEMDAQKHKDMLARCVQTGTVASLRAVRNLKDLADTVHLLAHTVRGMQEQVRYAEI